MNFKFLIGFVVFLTFIITAIFLIFNRESPEDLVSQLCNPTTGENITVVVSTDRKYYRQEMIIFPDPFNPISTMYYDSKGDEVATLGPGLKTEQANKLTQEFLKNVLPNLAFESNNLCTTDK